MEGTVVKQELRNAISSFCRWRVNQNICEEIDCEFCPVNDAYNMARDIEELEDLDMPCGDIMDLDDFINLVGCGAFSDWDGGGYFVDKTGDEVRDGDALRCNVPYLQSFIGKYDKVSWYNK